MQDRADALRHNDDCGMFHLGGQCLPEQGIGFVIQSGKAVVKQEDLRVLGDGPGNGKPLLLSAGDIASALGNGTVVGVLLLFDKILCLSNVGGFFHCFVRNVRICKFDIGSDCTGKEDALLGNQSDQTPEFFLGKITDVDTVQRDRSFLDIIKPWDEMDQRGFAAAGTSDDGGSLTGVCGKGYMFQYICFGIGIAERNIMESQSAGKGTVMLQRLIPVADGRGGRKNLIDPS